MADNGVGKGGLLDGLKNSSVPARDESFKPKGGSVDDEPVRKGVAKTPKTLGPRTA